MPKFFKKTLILTIILAIFLAPVSGGIKINENNNLVVDVKVNEVKAVGLNIIKEDTKVDIEIKIDSNFLDNEKNYSLFVLLFNKEDVDKSGLPLDGKSTVDSKTVGNIENSKTIKITFEDLTPKKNYSTIVFIAENESFFEKIASDIFKQIMIIPRTLSNLLKE